eukprot:SAG11_NODE_7542_length_1131_cov_1.351744_2_plen_53_part_01
MFLRNTYVLRGCELIEACIARHWRKLLQGTQPRRAGAWVARHLLWAGLDCPTS